MAENAALKGPWTKYETPLVDAATPSPTPTPGAKAAGPWAKYAQPANAPAIAPVAEPEGGSFLPEVGKGIAAGAINTTGTMVKGLAAEQANSPAEREAVTGLAADFENIPTMTDAQWVDWQRRAGKGIRGLKEMDFLAVASQVRHGTLTPQGGVEALRGLGDNADIMPEETIQETSLFKTGQKIQDFASDKFAAAKDYEDTWTRNIAEGLGSTVPFMAAGAVPGVGPVAGVVGGSLATGGQQIDDAISKGATQEQIIEAARLGRYPGLTEQIPIETLFERVPLPFAGKLAGAISKVLAQAAAEGGQEAVQQAAQNLIARYVYKPDQDIMDGVAESAAIGGIVGGGLKVGEQAVSKTGRAIFGKGEDTASPSVDAEQEAAPTAHPAQRYAAQPSPMPDAVERDASAAPAAPEAEQDGIPITEPASSPATHVPPEVRATLRKMLWTDADIDIMSPEEAAAEVSQAIDPATPQEIEAASQYGVAPQQAPVAPEAAPVAPEAQAVPEPTQIQQPEPPAEDELSAADLLPDDFASRSRPATIETAQDLEAAGQRVNVEPSEAQAQAGNYKKAHVRIAGQDVTIENPKGSTRRNKNPDGPAWESVLPAHYGYIKRTTGADGDQLDVYVGDNPKSKKVYIIDQRAPTANGRFDEHKVILGADSIAQARDLYTKAFSDGSGASRIGAITSVSPKAFRDWLNTPKAHRTPYAMGKIKTTPEGWPADAQGKVKRPQSMVEFLAANGGVRDHKGELANMDADKVFVPGAGRLVRANGRSMDDARALLVENGYLQDAPDGELSTSTIDDMLVAMADDIGSRERFSRNDDDWAMAWHEQKARDVDERQDKNARDRARAELQELGIDPDADGMAEVIDLMTGGMTVDDALERDAMGYDADNPQPDAEATPVIPFFDEVGSDEVHPGAALADGAAARAGSQGSNRSEAQADRQDFRAQAPDGRESGPQGAGQETDGGSARTGTEGGARDTFDAAVDEELARLRSEQTTTEAGADGKPQTVIPGAERITSKEEAQRKADAPLKASKPQQDVGGLFGDDSKQTDLMDLHNQVKAKSAERDKEAAELSKAGGSTRFTKDGGKEAVTGPDMSEPGKFRLTRFDEDGPVGHTVYNSLIEANTDALREGYKPAGRMTNKQVSDADRTRPTAKEQAKSTEKPSDRFAGNKIFTTDKVEAARARLRSKLSQLNSGIDPEMLVDGMTIAGAYIESGVKSFADFAKAMTADFGKAIHPYLLSFWEGARNYPGLDATGMTSPKEAARLHADLGKEKTPELGGHEYTDADFEAAAEKARPEPKAETPATKSGRWTKIGVNARGNTVWEDDKGVRSYTENNVRVTEAVGFVPGGGIQINKEGRSKDYLVADEAKPVEPVKNTPAKEVEKISAPASVVEELRDHLLSPDTRFETINQARKWLMDHGWKAKQEEIANKEAEEVIEQAVVLAARDIIKAGKKRGSEVVYDRLVSLYERQPRLATRTSQSLAEQAYSTPMPLAYVVDRLANVAGGKIVYEPTAGNGALLIDADPETQQVHANELNKERSAALRSQGFRVTDSDAMKMETPHGTDRIVANPPFGAVRTNGESIVFEVGQHRTTAIDQAIVLKALEGMVPEGRAVFIVGSVKDGTDAERSDSYNTSQKRKFYKRLYDNYNVVDHFTVSGQMYQRQGAAWPVDVLVIDGKGKSHLPLPAAKLPAYINSWASLKGYLDGGRSAGSAADRGEPVPVQGRSEVSQPVGAIEEHPAGNRASSGQDAGRGPAVAETRSESLRVPSIIPDDRGQRSPVGVVDADQGSGILGSGGDAAGTHQRVDAKPRDARVAADANATGQIPYRPYSREGQSLNTLVPAALGSAMDASLAKIEQTHGDIDAYVAQSLGYQTSELEDVFSAEQIDAIALAIDNVAKGDAFIIGDQTGIGKGRVVAAAIRFAHRRGMMPVFVTEKPDLYGDMYRDLNDIKWSKALGREPIIFMTNSNTTVPLDDEAVEWIIERDDAKVEGRKAPPKRGQFTKSQSPKDADAQMLAILSGKVKPDVVFTTYDQMNTVKGSETSRRRFMTQLAPRAFLIMDESHNAGGQGVSQRAAKDAPVPRSQKFRQWLTAAKAVMYSSATYAKNPTVMDLYSRTDMAKAVDDPKDLPELIAKGKVPLQQVVASMLAESGQYARRERSFDGVEYGLDIAEVDQEAYASFANAIRSIFDFDRSISDFRKDWISDWLKENGEGLGMDGGIGDLAANSTEFASIMHNIVNQMLLAIKAKAAVERAKTALENGEKPVITLSFTNESFVTDYAADKGIAIGEKIDIDFKDVVRRYLDRTLRITIKKDDEKTKPRHIFIPVSDIPGPLRAGYEAAQGAVDEADLSALPVSPIDYIRHELTSAGYKVAEITGRGTMIDYKTGTLAARPPSEMEAKGKRVTIKKFNDGGLDVVILNRSGSTGVSLHSSSKYKDRRRRRMVIAQADGNIDTHMQMLGRIHRTGQVIAPAYTQLSADIPAEARPTAVLMKKMASLSANTTASRKSAFTADAVDFMNEYGDLAAVEWAKDNAEINAMLGDPVVFNEKGKVSTENPMQRLTGRIMLMTPTEQQDLLDVLTETYNAILAKKEAMGENALEAKVLDLQAEPVSSVEIKPAIGPSPFEGAAKMERMSVKSVGLAMKPRDVIERVADALGQRPDTLQFPQAMRQLERVGAVRSDRTINRIRPEHEQWSKWTIDGLKDPKAKENARKKGQDQWNAWSAIIRMAAIGRQVVLSGESEMPAIVIAIRESKKAKSPSALSSWSVELALPDSARTLTLPFSQVLLEKPKDGEESTGTFIRPAGWSDKLENLEKMFEKAATEGRSERFIATGNLLAAFDGLSGKGQIIQFTDKAGNVQPGILMPRIFDVNDWQRERRIRFQNADQVMRFITESEVKSVANDKDQIEVNNDYKGFRFTVQRKAKKIVTDEAVRKVYDLWQERFGQMEATVDAATAKKLFAAFQTAGVRWVAPAEADLAQSIVHPKDKRQMSVNRQPLEAPQAPQATQADINRAIDIVSRVADIRPQLGKTIPIPDNHPALKAWGENDGAPRSAAGFYDPVNDIIALAMDSFTDRTAYHEAFHRLQSLFLTKDERFLLQREAARLRALVGSDPFRNPAKMSQKELEAEAFGIYSVRMDQGRDVSGLHIGLRRAWERIRAAIRRARNLLAGHGYRTAEDIFKKAHSGEMKSRSVNPIRDGDRDYQPANPTLEERTEAFRKYMSQRTFPTIEEAQKTLRYYIDKWNRPDFLGVTSPNLLPYSIIDGLIVKRGSIYGISQKGLQPRPTFEASEEPIGDAPDVVWGGPDMQDYRKQARPGETVSNLFVALKSIPQEKLSGGVTGYDWSELEHGGAIPPVTLRRNKNGTVSILDGNHRIHFFRERGFDSIPAYVIAAKPTEQFQIAPPTNSEAFKRWFGDSKVVDEAGKPLVMYHGTRAGDFEAFDPSKTGEGTDFGWFGNGAYFTSSPDEATNYATIDEKVSTSRRPQGSVYPVYLKVENPYITDQSGLSEQEVKELREEGHDGIFRKEYLRDELPREIVVFEPSQIKSATGNRGTFDPADDRISFQLAPGQSDKAEFVPPKIEPKKAPGALVSQRIAKALRATTSTLKGMSGKDRSHKDDGESVGDYLTRKWIDYLHPLRMMQERGGYKLSELNDAYLNARLMEDRALPAIERMHDTYVAPAVKALAEGGASLEDLHKYLYALHAEERNRVVGMRHQKTSQFYRAIFDHSLVGASGMSVDQVREVMAEARKDPEKHKALRIAAGAIRDMIDANLTEQRKAGLISAETHELLTTQWKNYVPLKGMDGMSDDGFWRNNGAGGFDVRGDEFKMALGRFSEAENVIAHAITQNEQSILRQHKNAVGKAMARFINEFDPEGEHIAQVYWGGNDNFLGDITKAPEVYKRVIGKNGLIDYRRVPNPFSNLDDVLAAKVGGRTFYIRFRDPKIGLALRKMGMAELGTLSKIVRPLTVWQSIVNTRANPAFTPINIIRDIQTGTTHLLDEGFSVKQIATITKNIPQAMGALWRMSRKKAGDGVWDKMAAEYVEAGGKITFHGYATLEENLHKLQKQMIEAANGVSPWKAVYRAVTKFVGDLNDAGENGIRLASYAAARNIQGRTAKEAAFMARDLTVDFKKHGEIGPAMNAWFVFFNAAAQGAYNVGSRAVRSKAVRAAIATFIFGGMMQHIWNTLFSGDDDDGESYYHKMLINEPWKLERQYVFFIPGTEKYVSFPMAYGYNAFHHLGLQGAAIASGAQDPVTGILSAIRVAFDAFNPIGSGSMASMVTPTIGDPAVDIISNENFAGAPIYPEGNPFDRSPAPDSSQAFSTTHPAFMKLAELINWTTGGDAVVPGAVDVHPDTLEHLWGYFVGGLGRFVTGAEQTVENAVVGEFEPGKTPWVRNFYGEIDETSQRTEYYKEREAVLASEGYLKTYNERGETKKAADYQKDHAAELQSVGAFKAAEKQRKAMNKERRRLEADASIPAAQKDKRLKELEKAELDAMRQARTAYVKASRQ